MGGGTFFKLGGTNANEKTIDNISIQDFWGLELCNGFGGFGGR